MLEINETYAKIASRLIQTKPALEYIKNSAVSVIYLSSDEEKKKAFKTIYGDCTKVNPRYVWCCPCDFFITIYEPNIADFNNVQIEALIYHELLHVGIDDENGIEPKYYLKPHDIEDFDVIINEYGLHWNTER